MSRSRAPRFDQHPPHVEAPTEDEQVTPEERPRRRRADIRTGNVFAASSAADYRARAKADRAMFQARPDEDVWTDAVAAVEQRTEGWQARWVLAEHDGDVVVRSLCLEPSGRSTPAGGVTSNLLRALSPAQAAAAATEVLAARSEARDLDGIRLRYAKLAAQDMGPKPPGTPRRGRPPLPASLLQEVAVAYLEELPRGRGVLRRLSERFERPETTMRDWVRAARDREYLTRATQPGRRGALPGPRLLEGGGG